ncbi:peptide/nickel transport system substrate-binding protein [Amycolatopsis bartoniae]|uniref:Peptide ABC transporter substrate-binding protein n=1 Tax=Amycolatopsis bartoniae TaxID=941986 RepID=A0A8H9IZJ8_9PSEU|nr:ABC transporter substrate-binding protein [Amycolatopsis bartoniae]MBB2939833.1 peptide/nickel transport system substrate-binding protein [Amycolatopsis bartoniae]TVT07462.1 ABC transporter substrate-binding protein [Amycolatopsis bartoniae]GHF54821.1 peptide ABC transporter substrate-binding protein [Amycolatopsis bartoniae]
MKTVLPLVGTGVLALALAACGGGNAGGGAVVDGGTFTFVLGADPGNLDPHLTTLSTTLQVDKFLYDSLVNVDATGAPTAGLAAKWEGDTTKATYTLRPGVTCGDGTPVTASQVADNINFVGDPANAAALLGIDVPAGAKATADDAAGTVSVTAPSADAFLVHNVGELPIVCAKGMKDRNLLKQGSDGTGLYTLTEAVSSDHYTLTRRKDYAWGPGDWKPDTRGLPDTVVLRVVPNETTAANLLVSKEVNAAQILGQDRQRLKASGVSEKDSESPFGELWFNQKAGLPGADETVRRALTQALDLTQLGQVLTGGTGKPATSLVAPGLGPCNGTTIGPLPVHDVTAAKAALDAAGWTPGPDGVRVKNGQRLALSFYYPTSIGSGMQAGAELVQQQWNAVGAQVDVKGMTDTESAQILGGEGTWHAMLLPLSVILPTQLVPFLSGPAAPQGNNFASIQNPAYTAVVQQASAIAGADGCAKWGEGDRAVVQRLDVVPFVNTVRPIFSQGSTFDLTEGSIAPSSIRMLG